MTSNLTHYLENNDILNPARFAFTFYTDVLATLDNKFLDLSNFSDCAQEFSVIKKFNRTKCINMVSKDQCSHHLKIIKKGIYQLPSETLFILNLETCPP